MSSSGTSLRTYHDVQTEIIEAWRCEMDGVWTNMTWAMAGAMWSIDVSGVPARQGKPLKRRSVSRACKAYMRASEPGVRYRKQYRAKMRYWKREATQKPTLWAVEHGA